MSRLKKFIQNALILALASFIMRTVSVVFNAYISNRIGAVGMGLFSLIMSAYAFAVTLSTSGINLAVTRLVSEELATGNGRGAVSAMRRCILYALFFGTLSGTLLYFLSGYVSRELLCDERTRMSLMALSISLPFIALSNVLSGYFTAVRRIYKSAAANMAEQCVKICIILVSLHFLAPRGVEYACLALVIGSSMSEGLSFSYLFVLYLFDRRKHINNDGAKSESGLTKRMLGISLPIAFSAYLRSGLTTAEHVLIPRGLRSYGADLEGSLALYGVIHGMVFPLVLFPAAFCTTFASLIVPELSELRAKCKCIKESKHIKYIVSRSIKFDLLFAICVSGILIAFSKELGMLVYNNATAGKYICTFGILVPVMYLDTAVDGMLKGLGEQMASMRYNIIDAAISVLLVYLLVPRLGVDGYVVCVFTAEIVNAALSLNRLLKVTGVKFRVFEYAALPSLCALGAMSISSLIVRALNISDITKLALGIVCLVIMYILFVCTLRAISEDDRKWIRSIARS